MSFTDILFIFVFLPVSLCLYYLAAERYRKYVLLGLSLFFYACGSMRYFFLLLISLAVNVLLGRLISRFQDRKSLKTGLLVLGILCNLALLGYYKYADFALLTMARLFKTEPVLRNLILPLGLSFFTFKAISYLADVYLGKIQAERNPAEAALYLSFFAQIQSGPLSRFQDMRQPVSDSGRILSRSECFSEGVYRFVTGFNKKILIANVLSNITAETFAAPSESMSAAYAWLGAVCYSLELFFDFSGYSDMAIGISRMFGFSCPENFHYPYMTKSVSEFWRRWHITLGAWFRDYIYIPMGGSRVNSRMRLYLNLLTVWVLTGIWHGASWNFVFWGLGYFVLIAFEKTTGWPKKLKPKALRGIYRIFTLLFINFQWVIFRANGLRDGARYIRAMLSPGNPLADRRVLFLLRDNWLFILAGLVLCFPAAGWLEKKFCSSRGGTFVWNVLTAAVSGALFVWALSFVVSGQNNPFAYANF